MKPILIDALHIVMGVGKRLLNYLLAILGEKEVCFVLLKDARCCALVNEKYAADVVVMNY